MKRTALVVACVLPSMAIAQNEPPRITVIGTAAKFVIPDQIHWYITISHTGQDLGEVASMHADTVADLLGLLRDYGIEGDELQTSRMQFGENWAYRQSSRVQDGYITNTSVAFEFSSFERYPELWIDLAGYGGVSVSNVSYDHSDRIRFRNETRLDALAAAKEKAEVMAAALGATIGRPLLIEEIQGSRPSTSLLNSITAANVILSPDSDAGTEQANLAPGTIPITESVRVSFELIQQ